MKVKLKTINYEALEYSPGISEKKVTDFLTGTRCKLVYAAGYAMLDYTEYSYDQPQNLTSGCFIVKNSIGKVTVYSPAEFKLRFKVVEE